MRANHDGLCEDGGDIRRVIARTIDTPWREGDDMVTNIQVGGQWDDFVREFGDTIGLSISMAGEYADIPEGGSESENPGRWVDAAGIEHKRTIGRLYSAEESPYNALDFVEAPGANGRILAAIESARERLSEMNVREQAAFAGKPFERQISEASPSRINKEDIEMDEQTLRQILAEQQSAVEAKIAEALKPAELPVEKVTVGAVAEAVVKAGLSDEGRAAVYEAIDRGDDMAKAIERETAREAAIEKRISDRLAQESDRHPYQGGFIVEEGAAGDPDAELNAILARTK
jgi:hypothetical protein